MRLTVAEIVRRLGGRLEGSGSAEIGGVSGIRDAGPLDITFLSSPKYAAAVERTKAAAVIVSEEWRGSCPCALIRVKNVDWAASAAASLLAPPPVEMKPGVHATAVVAENVELGRDVFIGPHCVLEPGVRIGDRTAICAGCYIGHESVIGPDSKLYPGVTMRERTIVGSRVIIHNGAVIGSDGYGYVPEEKDGKLTIRKIPQIGIVEIGDDVEIGANATIDRARFGRTRIGNHVKIDNLVQIAHNVTIGDYTGILSQVGISGSTSIGSRVILWGQAGLVGHLTVGDGAVVGAQAGVTKDVRPGDYVTGYPAMPHEKAAKNHANLMRLPELKKRVAELESAMSETRNELRELAARLGDIPGNRAGESQ